MINSVLYAEINFVCALILLLLCVKVKKSMFLQIQRHLFFSVAVANILFLLVDALWIFVDNKQLGISISLNWVLNAAYYIISGVLGFLWFLYSESVQESKLVRDNKYLRIAVIPVVMLILLTGISFYTGWLFYIDGNNKYHRGPAYVLQLLNSYGYVIFTACKAMWLSFQTDNYRRKKDLRTLFVFVLPTLLAGGVQVLLPGLPILCIGNTFGLLYVYLTLQEQLISVDALTKLNNRNQLFQYLSMKLAHPGEQRILYLLIMDVDHFKAINDQYGHVEGDRALQAVANCLMKSCGRKYFFISRYGGDEFVVICELEREDGIKEVCNSIHQELDKVEKPCRLSMSIGYTKYTKDIKNQQEFIARADQELYKMKHYRK